MTTPTFTFDEDANGWLSDEISVTKQALIHIELAGRAPVVTLKQEPDGGYANYGQTPKESDRYELTIHSKERIVVRLATPVRVLDCYIV